MKEDLLKKLHFMWPGLFLLNLIWVFVFFDQTDLRMNFQDYWNIYWYWNEYKWMKMNLILFFFFFFFSKATTFFYFNVVFFKSIFLTFVFGFLLLTFFFRFLFFFSFNGFVPVVNCLIHHKADVNAKDLKFVAPLHVAALKVNLFEKKKNINIMNRAMFKL